MSPKAQYSWFNLAVVMVLCLGSLSYGFCFSVISNTLGQPNFYTDLGLSPGPTSPLYDFTNRIIGAANGLFSAGGFMGALTIGWMCDRLGRRKTLVVSAAITVLGGALSGGAAAVAMFVIARWVTGYGVGMLVTLVPIYQAEIVPPASRGFLGSQHGVILVLGYSIAAWMGVGTYYASNPAFQWRFPLAMECFFPLLIILLAPVIPESPRWLLLQNRKEEAWTIVQKLHNNPSDPDQLFAREEYYQMMTQADVDRPLLQDSSVLDLFRKPSYRKRLLCGGLTTFACQSSGILVIYNYSVILYQGLGYSGALPLLLAAAYVSCTVPANYICAMLIDRLGRVRLLVIGLTGCMIALSLEAAMSATYGGTNNAAGLKAGVFFLFLYVFIYGCCLDATSFVYCAEIFPTHIRPQGMGFSMGVMFLTTIPYLSAAATAFANIGWRYYLVFICLTAVNASLIYKIFPETKGLSLEEINEKFGDSVAVHLTNVSDEEKRALDARLGDAIPQWHEKTNSKDDQVVAEDIKVRPEERD